MKLRGYTLPVLKEQQSNREERPQKPIWQETNKYKAKNDKKQSKMSKKVWNKERGIDIETWVMLKEKERTRELKAKEKEGEDEVNEREK